MGALHPDDHGGMRAEAGAAVDTAEAATVPAGWVDSAAPLDDAALAAGEPVADVKPESAAAPVVRRLQAEAAPASSEAAGAWNGTHGAQLRAVMLQLGRCSMQEVRLRRYVPQLDAAFVRCVRALPWWADTAVALSVDEAMAVHGLG